LMRRIFCCHWFFWIIFHMSYSFPLRVGCC